MAVEVHVSNGIPGFTVVGLPDAAVRESRDRVRAALLSSGLPWPMRKVTVNLAPSGVRKGGAGLDLAIAIGLLVATGEIPSDAVAKKGFIGELGLDGSLRPVPGIIALVSALNGDEVVVPAASATEASFVPGRRVRFASSLGEVVSGLCGRVPWSQIPPFAGSGRRDLHVGDISDVRGQAVGKRALEIAAAGGHHILFVGPPGSGKTLLSSRLPGILPDLTDEEALEVLRIQSAAGMSVPATTLPRRPPFRQPHHGATEVSLIGGGSTYLRPGEITLAHRGVLFLDELGEFRTSVLDMLRQPLEEGVIRISRARQSAELPARFQLVAAMNPCPCGEGVVDGACRCSDIAKERYRRRLSGPLLDRFDLLVALGRPEALQLMRDGSKDAESSATVASRVRHARALSRGRGVRCNGEIPAFELDRLATLTLPASRLLEKRISAGSLSARGLHRIRRVARTIADLDSGSAQVNDQHIAEALQLRAAQVVGASGKAS